MIKARIAMLDQPYSLRFEIETIDPSSLAPGDVFAETIVSAISPGTELAAYVGAPHLRPGVVYPRLVGYCNVARVIACGPETPGLAVGDRILSFSSHRSHFRIGVSDILAVLPDDDIASDDAVCAYLFHLGYNAVLKADIRPGTTVVVLGMGVLGLASVAVASLAGARVFAVSDHTIPQSKALEFGAERCFSRAEMPLLLDMLGPGRAQAVITTSNLWSDWRLALESAGDHGTIAVLGFPGRQEAPPLFNPLDSAHFYLRQLRIVAAGMSPERSDSRGFLPFNERDNLQRLLGWIQRGRLHPAGLISGRFNGQELEHAYESLLRRENSPLTYLLDWTT